MTNQTTDEIRDCKYGSMVISYVSPIARIEFRRALSLTLATSAKKGKNNVPIRRSSSSSEQYSCAALEIKGFTPSGHRNNAAGSSAPRTETYGT